MKLKQKLMAAILAVMMLMGYASTLTQAVIASGINLKGQNNKTNHANVEFNSYFEGDEYSKTFKTEEEAKLYIKLKVKNGGYLKNGVVKFANSNFEVDSNKLKNDKVQNVSLDQISLKQINNSNDDIIIEVPVTLKRSESVAKDFFTQVTLVSFTGIYVDENGKEREIKKELNNQLNWNGTAESELAGEISKYIPYQIGEEKGVLVQARIRSSVKDNSLPVQNTKLEVSLPSISEDTKPSRITVLANTTAGTNGKGETEFTTSNYKYNEETGKVEIEVSNNEENGKISWKKKAVDEYLVNYIYTGEEIYNQVQGQLQKAKETIKTEEEKKDGQVNENAIKGEIEVKQTINVYNNEETKLEQTGKINYSIEEETGKIVETSINSVSSLSKGYIYANYAKAEKETKKQRIEAKKDTDFEVKYAVKIQDKELTNAITFETETEKYLDSENEYETKVDDKENIYTKTVKISETVFKKMLGEEGKIEITDKSGKEIAQITKETEKDSKGNYTVDISEAKVNEIIIKTSKIITEGKIEVAVVKAINADQNYTKAQMKQFEKIALKVTTKANLNITQKVEETENEQEKTTTKTVEISKENKETKINLTEPVSKAEISINTKNLSTIVENKDVELRAVLDTSNIDNALYKNPILQLVLPENIETIKLNSVDLILEDELKVKSDKVEEQNGRKLIKITLEGTQTKYMDNGTSKKQDNIIAKGANIVIKADIAFKKLTPSSSSKIYLQYTNENTDLFEKTQNKSARAKTVAGKVEQAIGYAETGIEIVAPSGVVTENHITDYNISNTTDDKQQKTIEPYGKAKEITIGGTVVNNCEGSIQNLFVLGRTPFSGNKKVVAQSGAEEELGSNFTMKMKNKITFEGIDSSKIKAYYSTNAEANQNLIDANNNWTEEPTNISEVKSYLIVITGEVAKGTSLSFNYKVEIPENLPYSSSSYTNYKAIYDYKIDDATLSQEEVSGVVGITTGIGPDIKVEVKSNSNNVKQGQIVRMTATVKNEGSLAVENAKLQITAPEGTVHTEIGYGRKSYTDSKEAEKIITLGTIKPGETIIKEYDLKIKNPEQEEPKYNRTESGHKTEVIPPKPFENTTISNIVTLSADNITSKVKSESYDITVEKGHLLVTNIPSKHETDVLKKGDKVQYRVTLENISLDTHLENVTLHATLPTGIKIENVYYTRGDNDSTEKLTNGVNINGNTITVNVGKLESSKAYANEMLANLGEHDGSESDNEEYIKLLNSKLDAMCASAEVCIEFSVESFQGNYDCIMNATADKMETHYSNVQKLAVEKVDLQFSQKELNQKYVKEGSQYSYNFTLKNNGKIDSSLTKMQMTLPEGLSFVKAQYTKEGKTEECTSNDTQTFEVDLRTVKPGETIDIEVTVRANILPDEKDKEVTTVATITADGITAIESNKVKTIIEYDENAHEDEQSSGGNQGGNQTNPSNKTYKITGTAWVDANKDGKRDESEELLSGVQVVLLYKSNSQLVEDEKTRAEKITTTNSEGQYQFTGLKSNEYLVLFLYDAGKYSITDYQKQGVAETVNSDATNMKIVLNGEQRQAGVSNTIKITNDNARDIDIGLYVAEKFDLRLDKYISKITVTTPSNGTKTYNYVNEKIIKREIAAKDVGKSSIVVEYKIVVTNQGQVEGYAKKIIDYLPENIKFSTELNKDWYISENNGAVYNTALANEKIAPGQSKEVKLVLSFNVTEKNIGTLVNNNAEIYESYNELGIEDIDSMPANRLETEDDMSRADVVLSVATGKVIIYVTFTLAIIVLLSFGIYEIRKRVLIGKKN